MTEIERMAARALNPQQIPYREHEQSRRFAEMMGELERSAPETELNALQHAALLNAVHAYRRHIPPPVVAVIIAQRTIERAAAREPEARGSI